MARTALVLDASVGVKWFSSQDENALKQALAIRDAHVNEDILVVVPDLFYYEVANALVHKNFFSLETLRKAGASLLALGMYTVRMDAALLEKTVRLSRQARITVYDSCYAVVAGEHNCPLVTANPRHQKSGMGCEVIPIERYTK